MLVPPPVENKKNIRKIVKEMLAYRDQHGPTLGPDLTIRDLIEEGRTGFLVPIRSPEAIAEKISWFAGNQSRIPDPCSVNGMNSARVLRV